MNGNGTEAGQIIATTVPGQNGKPKQVTFNKYLLVLFHLVSLLPLPISLTNALDLIELMTHFILTFLIKLYGVCLSGFL